MLSKRKEIIDSDGSLGYIESVYFSDNVIKSTYFPKTKILYLTFNRGAMYSYTNIEQELYDEFESVDSQGSFLHSTILKKTNHTITKEFTLYPEELMEIKNYRNSNENNEPK